MERGILKTAQMPACLLTCTGLHATDIQGGPKNCAKFFLQ